MEYGESTGAFYNYRNEIKNAVDQLQIQQNTQILYDWKLVIDDSVLAHKTFKFPEDHHMATEIAVGYYGGEIDDLSGDLKKEEKKDRQRKKQDEFVFNGNYVDRADVSEDKKTS